MKTQTILVPYDGTENSEYALFECIKLSKIINAKVVILFVIEDKFFTKSYLQKLIPIHKNQEQEISSILNNTARDLLEKKIKLFQKEGVNASYIIERGFPDEIILKKAKETYADIIMIGRKSLKGFEKLKSIGSTSRKVVEKSDIPVILVGQKSNGKNYDKILIPYDIEDSTLSDNIIKTALKIKERKEHCKIIVLHVIQEFIIPSSASSVRFYSKITGQKIPLDEYFKELYAEIKDDVYKILKEKVSKTLDNTEINVIYGNPASKIIEFVDKNKIDLVIMGTNTLQGASKIVSLGSVARKVAESIECPIMLIK